MTPQQIDDMADLMQEAYISTSNQVTVQFGTTEPIPVEKLATQLKTLANLFNEAAKAVDRRAQCTWILRTLETKHDGKEHITSMTFEAHYPETFENELWYLFEANRTLREHFKKTHGTRAISVVMDSVKDFEASR